MIHNHQTTVEKTAVRVLLHDGWIEINRGSFHRSSNWPPGTIGDGFTFTIGNGHTISGPIKSVLALESEETDAITETATPGMAGGKRLF